MRRLAGTYYSAIKANALDKRATHVAVLDVPDISLTPRIQAALAQVAAANGGGAAAATAAANVQAVLRQWTDAFNANCAPKWAAMRVAVVAFNADFYGGGHAPDRLRIDERHDAGLRGGRCHFLRRPAALHVRRARRLAAHRLGGRLVAVLGLLGRFPSHAFGHRLLAASVSRALARAGWL